MSDDKLRPLEAAAWLCELMQEDGNSIVQFVEQDPAGLNFNDMGEPNPYLTSPLYTLTPEDVAAVNASRKDRAEQALRRPDLCRCDHNEYCRHCWPMVFRPGGVWGRKADGKQAGSGAPDA